MNKDQLIARMVFELYELKTKLDNIEKHLNKAENTSEQIPYGVKLNIIAALNELNFYSVWESENE